jgi:hypothetical protein
VVVKGHVFSAEEGKLVPPTAPLSTTPAFFKVFR